MIQGKPLKFSFNSCHVSFDAEKNSLHLKDRDGNVLDLDKQKQALEAFKNFIKDQEGEA